MRELALGQVVRSVAGRDKDLFMVVVGIDKSYPDYVYVSEGRTRKIDRPKRKKLKHLAKTNRIVFSIREKLNNGEKIQNAEIVQALESFNHPETTYENKK